ncbi:uncharacterized protein MELLADRAFT_68862 [Melampsora larici-populina 98AG31]|uniref:Uncharacterized protein n=1 Tax=Melampsora larici-populina (strain 98AG31 / pathotype 3-4-7) TaxID=747676 RepID=F4S8G5_MELLP|nr:uncharacterized protein MELLADRAFT_68862 [Melampsora larici-populina 98AG31]EGF99088.1 hypothetical protein MELLADRAFT_68862 [Melampsora larici-populina 98AG31]
MSSSVQGQPYTSHAAESDSGTPCRPIRTRTQVKTPGMVAQTPDSRRRITIPDEECEKANKKRKASAEYLLGNDSDASSVLVQPKKKNKKTSSQSKRKADTDAACHDDEVSTLLHLVSSVELHSNLLHALLL